MLTTEQITALKRLHSKGGKLVYGDPADEPCAILMGSEPGAKLTPEDDRILQTISKADYDSLYRDPA